MIMYKTLVVIDKPKGNRSRVAIFNEVTKEWVMSSTLHHKDVAYCLEDFGLLKDKKDTRIMMPATHPAFIELKNLGYRIEEVTL